MCLLHLYITDLTDPTNSTDQLSESSTCNATPCGVRISSVDSLSFIYAHKWLVAFGNCYMQMCDFSGLCAAARRALCPGLGCLQLWVELPIAMTTTLYALEFKLACGHGGKK